MWFSTFIKNEFIALQVFGQGFMSGNSSSPFADMLKNVPSKPFYEDPAYVAKAKADMAALKEKEGKKEAEDDGDADANAGADEEYEPQVDFKPVIPTPDLVNVVTGEEDEEVCETFSFIHSGKDIW